MSSAIAAGASGNLSFTASAVGSLSANVALGLESLALAGTGLDDKTLTAGAIAVTGAVYDVATATHDATFALGDCGKIEAEQYARQDTNQNEAGLLDFCAHRDAPCRLAALLPKLIGIRCK